VQAKSESLNFAKVAFYVAFPAGILEIAFVGLVVC
jgi:hypothetical protein